MWKWNFLCWLINFLTRKPRKRRHHFERLSKRVSVELDQYDEAWKVATQYSKTCPPVPFESHTTSNMAIVVQGPVVCRDNLTLETLKLYRGLFANQPIILSTWEDASPDCLSTAEQMGIHIVTGPPPEHFGPANLNMQIVSTRRGIEKAEQLGAKYTLKTRTDTRLHSPHLGDFLTGLLKSFPIRSNDMQQERIAVLDHATRLYIPYHPSDILMFGRTEDLLRYWSAPLCIDNQVVLAPQNFGELIQEPSSEVWVSEVWLCRHFLEQLGVTLDGTLEQWWQLLADRFITLDRSSLGFFWPKYNYHENHALSENDEYRNLVTCSFRHWISIAQMQMRPSVTIEDLEHEKINAILAKAPAAKMSQVS